MVKITFNKLYRQDNSMFDNSTDFFYFSSDTEDCLLCVEWWADEKQVAPLAQLFTTDGDLLDDYNLNGKEISFYTKYCLEVCTH